MLRLLCLNIDCNSPVSSTTIFSVQNLVFGDITVNLHFDHFEGALVVATSYYHLRRHPCYNQRGKCIGAMCIGCSGKGVCC